MQTSLAILLHAAAAASGVVRESRFTHITPLTRVTQAAWIYLHKHTVRGDHALSFYTACTGSIYLLLRRWSDLQDSPLKTTASFASIHVLILFLVTIAYRISPWHPLASYPGPFLARIGSIWLAYVSFTGRRHLILDRLHETYGRFVRIGR